MKKKESKTPIVDFVDRYVSSNWARFHMPGHKGNLLTGFEERDLTEIKGADELYHPDGIIQDSEAIATELFGTGCTVYSTEGSSQCIRAMLTLAAQRCPGGRIFAARNVHKAFVYAAALLDIKVQWLYPKECSSLCSCIILPEDLEAALKECPDPVAGVYLTSPDYLGGLADISSLSAVCHQYQVPLLVDNAHGAYLHFLPTPIHPMDLGADLCCDSAHKTLPALTGSAYLHLRDPKFGDVKAAMELFGSTSPSYLILQSLDAVNDYLTDHYCENLKKCCELVKKVKKRLTALGWRIAESDPLRIVLDAPASGWNGISLGNYLREGKMECEYADEDSVVLMVTPETHEEWLEHLCVHLGKNDRASIPKRKLGLYPGEQVISLRQAVLSPHEELPVHQAMGRICGVPTVSCPPAIPIVISGERIEQNHIELLERYGFSSLSVVK